MRLNSLRAARHQHRQAQHRQAGLSLVEVLIVVMLVSTVLLAAAAGMLVLVRSAADTRARQEAELALSNAIETYRTTTYQACSASGGTVSYTWTQLTGVATPTLTYWNGTGFQATCPATDAGAQLVTVTYTSPAGRTASGVFVLRRGNPT